MLRIGCCLLAVEAAICLSGCASSTKLLVWQPVPAEVQQIRRLVVVPPRGDAALGAAYHDEVYQTLAATQFYELVDPRETAAAFGRDFPRHAENRTPWDDVQWARGLGADAALIGQVSCNTGGSLTAGNIDVQIGERSVEVTVEYELVELRTGQVLSKNRLVRRSRGEPSEHPASNDDVSGVSKRLSRQLGDDVAARIAPRQIEVDVALASPGIRNGASVIRHGNRLAQEGDWSQAEVVWQAALRRQPQNPQLLYSVGLANEAQQRFDSARSWYLAAQNIAPSARLDAAVARVDQQKPVHELAVARLQERELTNQRRGILAAGAASTPPDGGWPPPAPDRPPWTR